jgi:hypothetical protein
MSRRGLFRTLAALTCAAGAITAAGCGTANVANVVDPVARAADVSTGSPGYKMLFTMRITTPALPTAITATGTGAFNSAAHAGSLGLAMDFGNLPQVQRVLGSGTLRMEEILEGTTVYMKLPAFMAGRPTAGKPWIRIDLARAASAAGIPGLGSLLDNPASGDPSQMLRYLRATSGSVTRLGTATVDGVQTTHYSARLSLDRVPNGFPLSSRPEVRQTVAALERLAHIHVLPVQVWVDNQHLVRRMEMSFDETVVGQALTAQMSFDIPQYGPQPVPAPPPASQVADASTLAGGAAPGAATASG